MKEEFEPITVGFIVKVLVTSFLTLEGVSLAAQALVHFWLIPGAPIHLFFWQY